MIDAVATMIVASMIVVVVVVATMIVVVNCLLCIAYGIMRVSSKNELFFGTVGGRGGGQNPIRYFYRLPSTRLMTT